MTKPAVTIFASITETGVPYYITVDDALDRIRTGISKDRVEKIRSIKDKDERAEVKKGLPCICFSGTFSKRAESALIQHSGFMVLDFDELSEEEIAASKHALEESPFVYAVWVSPSGNGLKALIKIADPARHRDHFLALNKDWPKMDKSGKDISRVCYESYDPNIYININAVPYTKLIEKQQVTTKVTETSQLTDQNEVYSHIKRWLEKQGCGFYEGNRNNYIMRLASACNRFGIFKEDAQALIVSDYLSADGTFTQREIESVIKSVYGKFQVSFGTAVFEENKMVDKVSHIEIPSEVLDMTIEPKDVIYVNDVKEDMVKDFLHGTSKGETTYFPGIDNHYRFMRGEVTLLGGHGNHGKTQLLLQLLLIKSVKEGSVWAIFCPENAPPIFFFKELIRTYIGKPVDAYRHDKMSEEEYRKGMEFIQKHFIFVYPKTDSPTPDYMTTKFLELIIKKKIDGCVIDPFNQLDNDGAGSERDDKYIGKVLSKFSKFSRDNNVYFFIIAHPKGGFRKMDDGNYDCPDVYDFSGGAIWSAKADNILMYHRPYYQTDKASTSCLFKSLKIKKQMLNGVPGEIYLDYNRSTGRYYENGNSPFDSIAPPSKAESALRPIVDFTQPIRDSKEMPF